MPKWTPSCYETLAATCGVFLWDPINYADGMGRLFAKAYEDTDDLLFSKEFSLISPQLAYPSHFFSTLGEGEIQLKTDSNIEVVDISKYY